MPSLPGDVSNVCAATEHNGRFYVAMTVNGPSMSTIDKTPTQVLQLCYLQKRQWYVMDVESPPDARYATALVSHGGKLFLVTAQSGGDSIWILNQHNRWEFVTATVNGEVASAACLVGDQIVMAGGSMNDEHGTSFSFVKSFCISSSTWNHGWPLLRHARNSARLVLMGNTLCVFGKPTLIIPGFSFWACLLCVVCHYSLSTVRTPVVISVYTFIILMWT